MERIAVVSDIHGNMPAFTAMLDNIARRGVSRIVCLGDLAGKGPDGDRVIDICQDRCEAVIRGNWDEGLAKPSEHPAFQWYRARLGPDRCAYLGALPNAIDLELGGHRIRLVHASPIGVYHRVHQSAPIEQLRAMFNSTDFTGHGFHPDVVGYGDIHTAFVRSFHGQVLFNAGSVGNPLDLTLACYVILEGPGSGATPGPGTGALAINTVRAYDIERAIRDAEDAGMPDLEAYAFELRTARYRGAMPQMSR